MQKLSFKKVTILLQIAFWTILITGEFIEELVYYSFIEAVQGSIIQTAIAAIAVYVHYLILLPYLFDKKRWILYSIGFLLLPSVLAWGNYYIYIFLNPEFVTEMLLTEFLIIMIPYFLILTVITSIYRFAEKWHVEHELQSNLRNQKLESELNFLKAQINPHFLFNTLNNIYSFAITQHPKTIEMIEKLSNMLRYMIYDTQLEQVNLAKEVEVIENLIELYKIKNSAQQNITLEHSGINNEFQIAPLLLLNFVENAFKHSDVLSNIKGFVHIDISVTDQKELHFKILNSIKEDSQSQSKEGGVGLVNTKRRLEITYKDQYSLETKSENNQYQVYLKLKP